MRGSPIWRRRAAVVAVAAAVVVAALLLFSAEEDATPDPPGVPTTDTTTGPEGVAPDPAGPTAGLSPDELVEAVMLVGFEGAAPGSKGVADLGRRAFGGVLIGADNWRGAGPGRELIAAVRAAGEKGAKPPLVATVQEGGPYRSLGDLPPNQREIEIGDSGDPAAARRWSEETAQALDDVGIDLNLAPVADVATLDSPIADRAFSDDPALVAALTAAAVEACGKAGIACAVSHFPGLGAVSQDTDDGPASVGLDAASLIARDLVPFRAAFAAGASATVISHAFYGGFDPVTPASLSPAIATDLLRDEAGFDGVAISDDIGAGAVAAVSTPADAAVRAIGAGIDLVQVADPRDVEPVRRALLTALGDGTLSEERLREAAGRVLALQRDLASTKGG